MSEIMVSVCMITYNHEPFIREAIEGVLIQQTNFPFELVIGEDCSTDRTLETCIEYQQKFPEKIRLLPKNENLGMMPNFIQTLKACSGKYVAICEGDDYWTDPLKLQKQVEFLEGNEEYSLCFTNAIKYYELNKTFKKWHLKLQKKEYKTTELLSGLVIPTCTAVFKNNPKLFSRLNNPDYIFGDMVLWLTCLESGKAFCLPWQTAVYRKHEASVSAVMNINKQLLLLRQHEAIANDFGRKYYKIEQKLLSRQYLVVAIKLFLKRDKRFSLFFIKSLKKNPIHLPANLLYIAKRLIRRDYFL